MHPGCFQCWTLTLKSRRVMPTRECEQNFEGKLKEVWHAAIFVHMFQILVSVYNLSYLLCWRWLDLISIFSTLIVILWSGDLIGARWRLFEASIALAFEVQEGGRRGMKAEHPDMTGRWSRNDFLFWAACEGGRQDGKRVV